MTYIQGYWYVHTNTLHLKISNDDMRRIVILYYQTHKGETLQNIACTLKNTPELVFELYKLIQHES